MQFASVQAACERVARLHGRDNLLPMTAREHAPTPILPRQRRRGHAARRGGAGNNPPQPAEEGRVGALGRAVRDGWNAPADLLDRVLYRDGLVLIVDKPAGIPVHSGPGGGPHLEHWFPLLRFGLPHPPALAHRLDRDTSGCLVLGRHPKALRRLGRLFAEGLVEKVYWAVVAGAPPEPVGRIETGLRKLIRREGWRMVVAPEGRP